MLFDWIDVDGEAVSSSLLADKPPGPQLIDVRELTRKVSDANLLSTKSSELPPTLRKRRNQ